MYRREQLGRMWGRSRTRAHERYQAPAKIIRRECCGFMAGILARGNVTRQAQISAKRLVAKDLAFNVESLRGSDTGTGSSIAKTKLVDAKLEMVRSGWLFQYCAVIRRFCLLSGLDRIQRNKIDQCLQRCAGPGQGSPAVIEVLGSPITVGVLVSGNTNVNGASGETNRAIPVSGTRG